MASRRRLIIKGAKEVVRVTGRPEVNHVIKDEMKDVHVLRQSTENDDLGYSILVDQNGLIESVGPTSNYTEELGNCDTVIDASGMVVMPGLVDAHTHPVWEGDRVHEFAAKLGGASYMDVHKAGGGIHFTVQCTKRATEAELSRSLLDRLHWALRCGTTLLEAKSGYGLDARDELKLLAVLNRAAAAQPVELSITYCGGHAVPQNKTSDEATDDIVNVQIPELKRAMELDSLKVDNVDVFCETGVFSVQQSRRILEAGKSIGLSVNFHGDELSATGSAELGAELGARAVSHLEYATERGIAAMARSRTAAVVLPTTAFMLRLRPPPVRQIIAAGVPLALGSDFNPNAYCYSMPIVMYLACVSLHMTLEEALVASTINAAFSMGRGSSHGAVHPGRRADFLVIDAPKWEHLIYQFGCHEKLIRYVIKDGKIVYDRDAAQGAKPATV